MAQTPRDLTPERDARSFFGAELRHRREAHGLSQDGLGKLVHVSGDTVAKIEKALRWPHDDFARACDAALDTGGALGRLWSLVDGERQRTKLPRSRTAGTNHQLDGSAPRRKVFAPSPPPGVVDRPGLVGEVVNLLLPGGQEPDGVGSRVVAVCGPGGFGKTTLAGLVCADPHVAEAFSEVLWVETGESHSAPRLSGLISDLCRHLGEPGVPFDDPVQAGFHLATVLSGRQVLLVVDNVWSAGDLVPFLAGATDGAVLVTSRNARTCPAHARVVRVGPMGVSQTEQLLGYGLPEADRPQLRALAQRCGGWPLLASVVGSSLRQDVRSGIGPGPAVAAAVSALDAAGPGAFDVWDADERSGAIGEALETSLASLEAGVRVPGGTQLRDRYLSQGIFPAATAIPVEVLSSWWSRSQAWTPTAVRQFCRLLVDRSLAVAGPDGEDSIMLHDVFRAYLRELAGDRLPVWHASLLDAHRPGTGSWADLPTGSRYLWAHLPHHLHGAGLDSELLATLASPDYVTRKVVLLGHQALTKDRSVLDRCATDSPNDKARAETARLLSDSAYLLDGLRNPADIAATLLAQCLRAGSPAGVDRLRELASAGDLDVRVHWARAGPSDDGTDAGNGHVGAITSVAVHEDQVVSVGEDGIVRLRDLTSGRLVWSRQAHTGWIYATAVSPDGRTVATAGDDGQIRTWDARTGEPGGALTGHHRRVRSLAFTPRDRLLVSGGEDGQIRIWDIESRSCVGSLQTSGVPVWSVAVDSAQSVVAAVGEDDTVRLYDLRDGSLLDHGNCDDDWVRVAAFAPDRPLLVTAAATGPVRFWDVRNRALTRAGDRPVGERIRCLAFTQDGQAVAAGTENASMQLLPTTPDAPSPSTPPLPGVDWIRAVATGRKDRVVAGCEDGALRAWDPDGKEPPHLITAGATTVWSTAVLHERRLTFHGRSDGLVDVCDSDSGHVRQQLTVGTGRVWSLAAARSHVAATCGDTHIRVWNAENLTLVADFDTEAGRTWAVALDPRGSRLAASSADGTVRIWDLPSGVLITRLRAHTGRIRSLAFDDRGDLLASAGGEGAARVWEVPTGACRTEIIDTSRWVRCVSLDPSGERLAVGYGPGDIHVHDVQSGGTLAELRGHNGRILALALGQDADPLMSAAADGTVRAWSPHSGRQLLQLRADASLNCAAIDRDSNMVLTGSANGLTAIHVSDVPADERTP